MTGLQTIDLNQAGSIGGRNAPLLIADDGAYELVIQRRELHLVPASFQAGHLGAIASFGNVAVCGDFHAPKVSLPNEPLFHGFTHSQVSVSREMNAVIRKWARWM